MEVDIHLSGLACTHIVMRMSQIKEPEEALISMNLFVFQLGLKCLQLLVTRLFLFFFFSPMEVW